MGGTSGLRVTGTALLAGMRGWDLEGCLSVDFGSATSAFIGFVDAGSAACLAITLLTPATSLLDTLLINSIPLR